MIHNDTTSITHDMLAERLGLIYVNRFDIAKACRIVCGVVSLSVAIFCLRPQASMSMALLGTTGTVVFLYTLLGSPTRRHLTFESHQRLLRWLQEDEESNDRSDI